MIKKGETRRQSKQAWGGGEKKKPMIVFDRRGSREFSLKGSHSLRSEGRGRKKRGRFDKSGTQPRSIEPSNSH